MKKDKAYYQQLLQLRRYDPKQEPPEEKAIFTINGKIIANNQNIVTLQAKQKSGKTTYLTALMASALTNTEVFRFLVHLKKGKQRIAYFDTEQGQSDFHKTIKRVKSLAVLQTFPGNFDPFNMREDDPNDIIGAINTYMASYDDIGLVIIDNSTDLLNSFNDEGESKKKIQCLKRWTKQGNSVMVQALHTGRNGDNTLGHYGAFSDRASQSVIAVERTERGSIVCKPKYLRSDEDFEPIEIVYDKEIHNWQETFYIDQDAIKAQQKAAKALPADLPSTDHRANLSWIFNAEGIVIEYSKLLQGIIEIYKVPRAWAKECIVYLIRENIVFKIKEGYTMQQQSKLFIQNAS